MKKISTLLVALIALAASVHAASIVTVNASAAAYNGLSLANGQLLPTGDLIRIGFFNLTDAQIQANNTPAGLNFLNSNFIEFGTAVSGDSFGEAGYFAKTLNGFTGTSGLIGKQIYLWVFNAATMGTATQQNVFYFTGDSNWIFPDDSAVNPLPVNPDLGDLTGNSNVLRANAHVVLQPQTGTAFPGGDGNPNFFPGSKTFNLVQIVPEPSSVMLLGAGVLGLLARRRRNS